MNIHNCHFIGATGSYPIEQLISNTSNNLIANDIYNSNQLIYNIVYTSNQLAINKEDRFLPFPILKRGVLLESSLTDGSINPTSLLTTTVAGYGGTLATHTAEIGTLTAGLATTDGVVAGHTTAITALTAVTGTNTIAIAGLVLGVAAKLDKSIISHNFPIYNSPMYIDTSGILQIELNNDLDYDTITGCVGLSTTFKNSKLNSSVVEKVPFRLPPFKSPLYIDLAGYLQVSTNTDLGYDILTGEIGLSTSFKNSKLNSTLSTANGILQTNSTGVVEVNSLISPTELNFLNNTSKNIEQNFSDTSNWVGFLRDNKLNSILSSANGILQTSATGVVEVNTNITPTELNFLNNTSKNIEQNFSDTSNWVGFLRDNKLNSILSSANGILQTNATGVVEVNTNITPTELNYLNNTSKNIEQNFSDTSNWVGFLRDNKLNSILPNFNGILQTNATGGVEVNSLISPTELNFLNNTSKNIEQNFSDTSNWIGFLRDNKLNRAGFTNNSIMITDASGNITVHSSVSSTELGYLDGLTQSISTSLSAKQNTITAGSGLSFSSSTLNSVWTVSGNNINNNNTGNVGIGINGSTSKLEVLDNIRVSTSGGTGGALYLGTVANGICVIRGTTGAGANNANDLSLITSSTGSIIFATGTAEKMRIDASGNVGIAGNDAGYKFYVNGNMRTIGDITCADLYIFGDDFHIGSANSKISISSIPASTGILQYQRIQTYGNTKLAINSLGNNVGIGTTNPAYIFDIINASPIMRIGTSGLTDGQVYFGNSDHGVGRNPAKGTLNGGNDVGLWTAGGANIGFCIDNSEKVRITANGKIIMNNTSASAPSNGDSGGASQRIVLYTGAVNDVPYGFGINSGELYYTTNNTGIHKFYTGITPLITIGRMAVSTDNSAYIEILGGNANKWRILVDYEIDDEANLSFYIWQKSTSTWNNCAYIEDDRTWGVQMNFTGQHRCYSNDKTIYSSNYVGYLVSCTGKYKEIGSKYGKNNIKQNINVNDALPYVELTNKAYDKNIFGVISNRDDDDKGVYRLGAFTSVWDKDIGDDRCIINSMGEGSLWVCNYNGNIEMGDFLCSSYIAGLAMKQDDDLFHNYTCAKATMNCDFNPQLIPVEVIKQQEYTVGNNIFSSNVLDTFGNPVYEYKLDESSNIVYDYEYEVRDITYNGSNYKQAFIGVSYKMT